MESSLLVILGALIGVVGALGGQWIAGWFHLSSKKLELSYLHKLSVYGDLISASTLFAGAPGDLERYLDYLRAYYRVKLLAPEELKAAMVQLPSSAESVRSASAIPDPLTFSLRLKDWIALQDTVEKIMSKDLQASLR